MGQSSSTTLNAVPDSSRTLATAISTQPSLDSGSRTVDGKQILCASTAMAKKRKELEINGWNCQKELVKIKSKMDGILREIKDVKKAEEENSQFCFKNKDPNKLSTFDSMKTLLTPKSPFFIQKESKKRANKSKSKRTMNRNDTLRFFK